MILYIHTIPAAEKGTPSPNKTDISATQHTKTTHLAPKRWTHRASEQNTRRRPGVTSPAHKPGPHCIRQRCSDPVCDRPSTPGPFRPVKTASSTAGGSFDGTKRAGARSDGRKQGRNSADWCGEDRTSQQQPLSSAGGTL